MSFADTGLDARLLRALAKRGLTKPTPVQLAAIPKTLEGKDVVARARTGSGKTLAYLLPVLHRLLTTISSSDAPAAQTGHASARSFQAVVLVPTRELCEQVKVEAQEVVQHCGVDIQVTALTAANGSALKRAVTSSGHLVVATPGKLAAAVREGALLGSVLESRLQTLVLDEADLLLSYGYEPDLQLLAPLVPRSCQVLLMSATTSQDVEALQRLVLHNPITLNLLAEGTAGGLQGEGEGTSLSHGSGVSSTITHWSLECDKDDRLLIVMALFKLGLVRRKVLVFVNTVDTAYRVKLFLETFGIRAALLNAEMPLNSRSHCLASFNKGMFDYLIATDDVHAPSHDTRTSEPPNKKQRKDIKGSAKNKKGGAKDEEFGVTRGIDFKGVRTIINYDLPSTTQGYVHRVGRTGRGGEEGAAVTFFTAADVALKEELEGLLDVGKGKGEGRQGAGGREEGDGVLSGSEDEDDEEVAAVKKGAEAGLQPFTRLSKAQIEALRYRGEDVARSITKNVIKEARAKELRAELLNSEKLKDYFESHAAERQLLRHDKALHKTPQAPSLKHLPAYLKDPTLIEATETGNRGAPKLSAHKKRKLPKAAAEHITGVTGADATAIAAGLSLSRGKDDPLKGVKGFVRAAKSGGHHDEELTDMEKRAMVAAKKDAKKKAKAGDPTAFVPKRNVRKFKRHR